MGLKYRKDQGHGSNESMWTSYSDLFMGLSFIFLLLYVTASLRTGTTQLGNGVALKKIAKENEELKGQIKVYESMRKDYMDNQASQDETKVYDDLMGQLDLLQDKTREERKQLEEQASDNSKKEKALNKYQQLVKSVINANVLAKNKIKKRENVIDEQDQEITTQDSQIASLKGDIQNKQKELEVGEQKIADAQTALQAKEAALKKSYKAHQMTELKYKQQQARIKAEAARTMEALEEKNQAVQAQLHNLDSKLGQTQQELDAKEAEVNQKNQALAAKDAENSGLKTELTGTSEKLKHLDNKLGETKKALGEKEAEVGQKNQALAAKDAENSGLKNALSGTSEKIKNLKGQLAGTEADLAKARAESDARKKVAREIQDAFKKIGVKADIDGVTGDVTIDFGDHFFESGSAKLKPEMTKILQKALPAYAKSLMENKTVSNKLSSLEIIGFASPTYKGRYIDPSSVKPEDKKAVEYNLDLSYKRAKSIFEFVFDPDKMSFQHQRQLRPLVKVSGKSFFDSIKGNRNVASQSSKEFCKVNDCKKAQKVLIKFNIDQK